MGDNNNRFPPQNGSAPNRGQLVGPPNQQAAHRQVPQASNQLPKENQKTLTRLMDRANAMRTEKANNPQKNAQRPQHHMSHHLQQNFNRLSQQNAIRPPQMYPTMTVGRQAPSQQVRAPQAQPRYPPQQSRREEFDYMRDVPVEIMLSEKPVGEVFQGLMGSPVRYKNTSAGKRNNSKSSKSSEPDNTSQRIYNIMTQKWWPKQYVNPKYLYKYSDEQYSCLFDNKKMYRHSETEATELPHAQSVREFLIEVSISNRGNKQIVSDMAFFCRQFFLEKHHISFRYPTSYHIPEMSHPPVLEAGYFPVTCDTVNKKIDYLMERYLESVDRCAELIPYQNNCREPKDMVVIPACPETLWEFHKTGKHIHGFFYFMKNKGDQRTYLVEMYNNFCFPIDIEYRSWDLRIKIAFDRVTVYNLHLVAIIERNRDIFNQIGYKFYQPYDLEVFFDKRGKPNKKDFRKLRINVANNAIFGQSDIVAAGIKELGEPTSYEQTFPQLSEPKDRYLCETGPLAPPLGNVLLSDTRPLTPEEMHPKVLVEDQNGDPETQPHYQEYSLEQDYQQQQHQQQEYHVDQQYPLENYSHQENGMITEAHEQGVQRQIVQKNEPLDRQNFPNLYAHIDYHIDNFESEETRALFDDPLDVHVIAICLMDNIDKLPPHEEPTEAEAGYQEPQVCEESQIDEPLNKWKIVENDDQNIVQKQDEIFPTYDHCWEPSQKIEAQNEAGPSEGTSNDLPQNILEESFEKNCSINNSEELSCVVEKSIEEVRPIEDSDFPRNILEESFEEDSRTQNTKEEIANDKDSDLVMEKIGDKPAESCRSYMDGPKYTLFDIHCQPLNMREIPLRVLQTTTVKVLMENDPVTKDLMETICDYQGIEYKQMFKKVEQLSLKKQKNSVIKNSDTFLHNIFKSFFYLEDELADKQFWVFSPTTDAIFSGELESKREGYASFASKKQLFMEEQTKKKRTLSESLVEDVPMKLARKAPETSPKKRGRPKKRKNQERGKEETIPEAKMMRTTSESRQIEEQESTPETSLDQAISEETLPEENVTLEMSLEKLEEEFESAEVCLTQSLFDDIKCSIAEIGIEESWIKPEDEKSAIVKIQLNEADEFLFDTIKAGETPETPKIIESFIPTGICEQRADKVPFAISDDADVKLQQFNDAYDQTDVIIKASNEETVSASLSAPTTTTMIATIDFKKDNENSSASTTNEVSEVVKESFTFEYSSSEMLQSDEFSNTASNVIALAHVCIEHSTVAQNQEVVSESDTCSNAVGTVVQHNQVYTKLTAQNMEVEENPSIVDDLSTVDGVVTVQNLVCTKLSTRNSEVAQTKECEDNSSSSAVFGVVNAVNTAICLPEGINREYAREQIDNECVVATINTNNLAKFSLNTEQSELQFEDFSDEQQLTSANVSVSNLATDELVTSTDDVVREMPVENVSQTIGAVDCSTFVKTVLNAPKQACVSFENEQFKDENTVATTTISERGNDRMRIRTVDKSIGQQEDVATTAVVNVSSLAKDGFSHGQPNNENINHFKTPCVSSAPSTSKMQPNSTFEREDQFEYVAGSVPSKTVAKTEATIKTMVPIQKETFVISEESNFEDCITLDQTENIGVRTSHELSIGFDELKNYIDFDPKRDIVAECNSAQTVPAEENVCDKEMKIDSRCTGEFTYLYMDIAENTLTRIYDNNRVETIRKQFVPYFIIPKSAIKTIPDIKFNREVQYVKMFQKRSYDESLHSHNNEISLFIRNIENGRFVGVSKQCVSNIMDAVFSVDPVSPNKEYSMLSEEEFLNETWAVNNTNAREFVFFALNSDESMGIVYIYRSGWFNLMINPDIPSSSIHNGKRTSEGCAGCTDGSVFFLKKCDCTKYVELRNRYNAVVLSNKTINKPGLRLDLCGRFICSHGPADRFIIVDKQQEFDPHHLEGRTDVRFRVANVLIRRKRVNNKHDKQYVLEVMNGFVFPQKLDAFFVLFDKRNREMEKHEQNQESSSVYREQVQNIYQNCFSEPPQSLQYSAPSTSQSSNCSVPVSLKPPMSNDPSQNSQTTSPALDAVTTPMQRHSVPETTFGTTPPNSQIEYSNNQPEQYGMQQAMSSYGSTQQDLLNNYPTNQSVDYTIQPTSSSAVAQQYQTNQTLVYPHNSRNMYPQGPARETTTTKRDGGHGRKGEQIRKKASQPQQQQQQQQLVLHQQRNQHQQLQVPNPYQQRPPYLPSTVQQQQLTAEQPRHYNNQPQWPGPSQQQYYNEAQQQLYPHQHVHQANAQLQMRQYQPPQQLPQQQMQHYQPQFNTSMEYMPGYPNPHANTGLPNYSVQNNGFGSYPSQPQPMAPGPYRVHSQDMRRAVPNVQTPSDIQNSHIIAQLQNPQSYMQQNPQMMPARMQMMQDPRMISNQPQPSTIQPQFNQQHLPQFPQQLTDPDQIQPLDEFEIMNEGNQPGGNQFYATNQPMPMQYPPPQTLHYNQNQNQHQQQQHQYHQQQQHHQHQTQNQNQHQHQQQQQQQQQNSQQFAGINDTRNAATNQARFEALLVRNPWMNLNQDSSRIRSLGPFVERSPPPNSDIKPTSAPSIGFFDSEDGDVMSMVAYGANTHIEFINAVDAEVEICDDGEDLEMIEERSCQMKFMKAFSDVIAKKLRSKNSRMEIKRLRSKSIDSREPEVITVKSGLRKVDSQYSINEIETYAKKKAEKTKKMFGDYVKNEEGKFIYFEEDTLVDELLDGRNIFANNTAGMDKSAKFKLIASMLDKKVLRNYGKKTTNRAKQDKFLEMLKKTSLIKFRGSDDVSRMPIFDDIGECISGDPISLVMDELVKFDAFIYSKMDGLTSDQGFFQQLQKLRHKKNHKMHVLIDCFKLTMRAWASIMEDFLHTLRHHLFSTLSIYPAERRKNIDALRKNIEKKQSQITILFAQIFDTSILKRQLDDMSALPRNTGLTRILNTCISLAALAIERVRPSPDLADAIGDRKWMKRLADFDESISLITLTIDELYSNDFEMTDFERSLEEDKYDPSFIRTSFTHKKFDSFRGLYKGLLMQQYAFKQMVAEAYANFEVDRRMMLFYELQLAINLRDLVHGKKLFLVREDFDDTSDITSSMLISAIASHSKTIYNFSLCANELTSAYEELMDLRPEFPMVQPANNGIVIYSSDEALTVAVIGERNTKIVKDPRHRKHTYYYLECGDYYWVRKFGSMKVMISKATGKVYVQMVEPNANEDAPDVPKSNAFHYTTIPEVTGCGDVNWDKMEEDLFAPSFNYIRDTMNVRPGGHIEYPWETCWQNSELVERFSSIVPKKMRDQIKPFDYGAMHCAMERSKRICERATQMRDEDRLGVTIDEPSTSQPVRPSSAPRWCGRTMDDEFGAYARAADGLLAIEEDPHEETNWETDHEGIYSAVNTEKIAQILAEFSLGVPKMENVPFVPLVKEKKEIVKKESENAQKPVLEKEKKPTKVETGTPPEDLYEEDVDDEFEGEEDNYEDYE